MLNSREGEREPLIKSHGRSSNKYTEEEIPTNVNESTNSEDEFIPLDGGYGWIVCLATFWCFGIIIGMDYNYSLIYNKLVVVYNTTENHVVYAGRLTKK